MRLNLEKRERYQAEIFSRREQIASLVERKVILEGNLALIEPRGGRTVTPAGAFESQEEYAEFLRNQLISLRSSLSETHPDVVRVKRQLTMLEDGGPGLEQLDAKEKELKAKERELEDLRARYSAKHPDVVSLEKEVEALRDSIVRMAGAEKILDEDKAKAPDNPVYISLTTQIRSVELEIAKEEEQIEEAQRKLEEVEERIEQTPKIEQEYTSLVRNYNTALSLYNETLAKLQAAREARGLEEENIAEKLTIIDPPIMPGKPFQPNRLLILLAGAVLSLGLGLGCGVLAEFMDHAIRGPVEVMEMTGGNILAVVPPLVTKRDKRYRRRLYVTIILGTLGGAIIATAAVHYLFMPLDILYVTILDRFNLR
jgi:uncharacterized protein involved in exopolysaccharide biosynthesis